MKKRRRSEAGASYTVVEDPDSDHVKKNRKSEVGGKLESGRQKEIRTARRKQVTSRRRRKSGSRASPQKREREDEVATVAGL